jgi:KamA family protein
MTGVVSTMRSHSGARLLALPQLAGLDAAQRHELRVVSTVLPFKVNDYVLDTLIDWAKVPDDPIFRMTFPARAMLPRDMYDTMSALLKSGATTAEVTRAATAARLRLNPHPSGQLDQNVPELDGRPVAGLQHKYRETALMFPSNGQTCHAYCGYCFRWAQFVGMPDLRFSVAADQVVFEYLARHREISDVLITGGDPLIMSTPVLRRSIEPLLDDRFEHVTSVRIGTKAVAYWPYRITSGPDADELLRLFEECAARGKNVAVMMHVSHPRELETEPAQQAIARLRSAGVSLRAQAPIIGHVNDDPQAWSQMWSLMVRLGIHPYYTFVERDTGAHEYFAVPLARALDIFQQAQRTVSGLGRTARGPVMSATPGKVIVDGETTIDGQRVFVLRLLQARQPELVGRPFFARWSNTATWLDELEPAFAERWPWEQSNIVRLSGVPAAGNPARLGHVAACPSDRAASGRSS